MAALKIRKVGNFLEIDGKWYFPKQHSPKDDGKAIIFRKVDKKLIEEKLGFIVEKLKPYLDKKMILSDALGELRPAELTKLSESLRVGVKPKVRKYYGCVEMQVNGVSIPIR
jgi:hypothetical protein